MGVWEKGVGLSGATASSVLGGWLGFSGWWGAGGWSAALGGALSGLLVALAFGLTISASLTLRRVQRNAARPLRTACPDTGEYEIIQIDPKRAVEAVCTGVPHRIMTCSRRERGCACTRRCTAAVDVLSMATGGVRANGLPLPASAMAKREVRPSPQLSEQPLARLSKRRGGTRRRTGASPSANAIA